MEWPLRWSIRSSETSTGPRAITPSASARNSASIACSATATPPTIPRSSRSTTSGARGRTTFRPRPPWAANWLPRCSEFPAAACPAAEVSRSRTSISACTSRTTGRCPASSRSTSDFAWRRNPRLPNASTARRRVPRRPGESDCGGCDRQLRPVDDPGAGGSARQFQGERRTGLCIREQPQLLERHGTDLAPAYRPGLPGHREDCDSRRLRHFLRLHRLLQDQRPAQRVLHLDSDRSDQRQRSHLQGHPGGSSAQRPCSARSVRPAA